MDLQNLRNEYEKSVLHKKDLSSSPIQQLRSWLDLAISQNVIEPNAMNLATSTKEGRPSSRVVLLRHIDETGLIFYTNYNSRKSKEIQENPFGCLDFWWSPLEKQVIIEGKIEKLTDVESDGYFSKRPRKSQIGAWTSQQDAILGGREELEAAYKRYEKEFEGKEIKRPPFWGGFRLVPERYEFWQGRPSRLHDRFEYVKDGAGTGWLIRRLSP